MRYLLLIPFFLFQGLLAQDNVVQSSVLTDEQIAAELRTVHEHMESDAIRIAELQMLYRSRGTQSSGIPRAMLGLGIATSDRGILVEAVSPRGPANDSGIERGDIVTHVNGESVAAIDQLMNVMTQVEPGDSVSLTIDREGFINIITIETIPMHPLARPRDGRGNQFLPDDIAALGTQGWGGRENQGSSVSNDRDDRRDRDDDLVRRLARYDLIEIDESLEDYFSVSQGLLVLIDDRREEVAGLPLIENGDVIVGINGQVVTDRRDFARSFVAGLRQDNQVNLSVIRRGEALDLLIQLN